MKVFNCGLSGVVAVIAVLALASPACGQAVYQQQIDLQPGWNAVFLEVEPEPTDLAELTAGLPIESVWTWRGEERRVGLLRDPVLGLLNTTGWYGFFPPGSLEESLSNLFHLRANRAYLVKLSGAQPVTWSLVGRPSLRPRTWVADSFNLVGFHVEPGNGPTFGDYFAPSSAHAGQPIYRLDSGSGTWQRIIAPFTEPIRSGEAYWVWTTGNSTYQGTLEVELEASDRLEFGASLTRQTVVLRNHLAADTVVRFDPLPSTQTVPLSYRTFEGALATWRELPADFTSEVPAQDERLMTLAIRRADFDDRVEHVVAISSDSGVRRLVLVGGNTTQSTTLSSLAAGPASTVQARATASVHPYAGLWIGFASIEKVSQAASTCRPEICPDASLCPDSGLCATIGGFACDPGQVCPNGDLCPAAGACPTIGGNECRPAFVCPSPTEPVAVGEAFDLRLLIHVDSQGKARLLKEVIQLFKAPTFAPDPNTPGFQTVIDPGNFVLLTDESLIPSFEGVALRDGIPVGLRASTVAYDFEGQTRELEGSFPGSLATELNLSPTLATNPFRHKYHPNHDGLDAQFEPLAGICSLNRDRACETNSDCATDGRCIQEVPTVIRQIALDFQDAFLGHCSLTSPQICETHSDCPTGEGCLSDLFQAPVPRPPGWGADAVGGVYSEKVVGLHATAIFAEGPFLLERVAATPVLNQD